MPIRLQLLSIQVRRMTNLAAFVTVLQRGRRMSLTGPSGVEPQ
jgi:hypothetical protein